MFKKLLMVSVVALLLSAGTAVADPSSSDWNDSWGFPSPAEKANTLAQAIEMEFVEEGGFDFNSTNYWNTYSHQYCDVEGSCQNGDALAIGNQIVIDGDNNSVDSNNDGNVGAQNNNGSGAINQNGQGQNYPN